MEIDLSGCFRGRPVGEISEKGATAAYACGPRRCPMISLAANVRARGGWSDAGAAGGLEVGEADRNGSRLSTDYWCLGSTIVAFSPGLLSSSSREPPWRLQTAVTRARPKPDPGVLLAASAR